MDALNAAAIAVALSLNMYGQGRLVHHLRLERYEAAREICRKALQAGIERYRRTRDEIDREYLEQLEVLRDLIRRLHVQCTITNGTPHR